jgi:hypothetical protein
MKLCVMPIQEPRLSLTLEANLVSQRCSTLIPQAHTSRFVVVHMCGIIRNRRLYTFPRHNKERVTGTGGLRGRAARSR